jgi:hypothetical protein
MELGLIGIVGFIVVGAVVTVLAVVLTRRFSKK